MRINIDKTPKQNLIYMLNSALGTQYTESDVDFGTPEFVKFEEDQTPDSGLYDEHWNISGEDTARAFVGNSVTEANENLHVNTKIPVTIKTGGLRIEHMFYHRRDIAKAFLFKHATRPDFSGASITESSSEEDIKAYVKGQVPFVDTEIFKAVAVDDPTDGKYIAVVPKKNSLLYYPAPCVLYLEDKAGSTDNGYVARYGAAIPASVAQHQES